MRGDEEEEEEEGTTTTRARATTRAAFKKVVWATLRVAHEEDAPLRTTRALFSRGLRRGRRGRLDAMTSRACVVVCVLLPCCVACAIVLAMSSRAAGGARGPPPPTQAFIEAMQSYNGVIGGAMTDAKGDRSKVSCRVMMMMTMMMVMMTMMTMMKGDRSKARPRRRSRE